MFLYKFVIAGMMHAGHFWDYFLVQLHGTMHSVDILINNYLRGILISNIDSIIEYTAWLPLPQRLEFIKYYSARQLTCRSWGTTPFLEHPLTFSLWITIFGHCCLVYVGPWLNSDLTLQSTHCLNSN